MKVLLNTAPAFLFILLLSGSTVTAKVNDEYVARRAVELDHAITSGDYKAVKSARYLFKRALDRSRLIYGAEVEREFAEIFSDLVGKADRILSRPSSIGPEIRDKEVEITQAVSKNAGSDCPELELKP